MKLRLSRKLLRFAKRDPLYRRGVARRIRPAIPFVPLTSADIQRGAARLEAAFSRWANRTSPVLQIFARIEGEESP